MAMNFADVATKKAADIEKPPLPPVGTYKWRITKVPETRKSADEKWEFLTVNCRAVEALDDVDTDEWKGDISNIMLSKQFIFNTEDDAEFEKTLYNVRTFFEKHVKCAEEDDTVGQMLQNSINSEFLGTVGWRQDKNDDENFFAEIKRTAPVE
jgi:hypothetical protein